MWTNPRQETGVLGDNLLRPEALSLKGTSTVTMEYRFLQFRHNLLKAYTYVFFCVF